MTTPTEAELFADMIEYRAVFEVLRAFDAGFVVNVERAHVIVVNGAYPQRTTYMVKIRKLGIWEVSSDPKETLQEAAEQARDRAIKEAENEPLIEEAKEAIAAIVKQQSIAEFNSGGGGLKESGGPGP